MEHEKTKGDKWRFQKDNRLREKHTPSGRDIEARKAEKRSVFLGKNEPLHFNLVHAVSSLNTYNIIGAA